MDARRSPITAVAVFCGSRSGVDAAHAALAETVGRRLAAREVTVVYGGGHVGLMGVVADAALAAGGQVVGVIPRQLDDREIGHTGLSELHVVDSMHARKQLMADLSDAFVALPGGVGTLEEITEQWTWSQLGIHAKPSAFLDPPGGSFWAPMAAVVDQMVSGGFVQRGHRSIPVFGDDLDALLDTWAT